MVETTRLACPKHDFQEAIQLPQTMSPELFASLTSTIAPSSPPPGLLSNLSATFDNGIPYQKFVPFLLITRSSVYRTFLGASAFATICRNSR